MEAQYELSRDAAEQVLFFIMFFPADNGGCREHAEKNHLRPLVAVDVDDDEATIGQTPDRPAQFILEGIEISATQGD